MLMPNLQHLTFSVRTFGCQMNMSDAERVTGILEAAGLLEADSLENADVAIFMTCCVREKADTQLFAQVSSLKNLPAPRSGRRTVMVGGCIGQRDGEAIRTHASNVDAVFGTQALPRLLELLQNARETPQSVLKDHPLVDVEEPYTDINDEIIRRPEKTFSAWLPIMYGCNNFCSYCIVPYVRGRERSRLPEGILKEAKLLREDGVKEVTLLGQNVNSYAYGFAELLQGIADIGFERIRFTSSHPKDLTDDIIDVMSKNTNIMPHLHLAVQSGSTRVLKKMNRKYTREDYLNVVQRLRTKIPHLCLTTDIIVGFPGETEDDFEETLSMVREADFDRAFTFIYSKRKGTPAATWENGSTPEMIADRFQRLVRLVEEQSLRANQKVLNGIVDVLVESVSKKDPSVMVGHSPNNVTVHFDLPKGSTPNDHIGEIVPVKIDLAKTWYLRGTIQAKDAFASHTIR